MKQKIIIASILIITAIVFLCLNLMVPYYDDDIWYSLHYIPGELVAPITQFSDIITSQYHHFVNENSRAIIHITLQSILSILPDYGFDILNTLIFILFICATTKYVQLPNRVVSPLALLLTISSIYLLLPDMDYLFYWAAGSLNYLWVSLVTIIFLFIWHKEISIKRNIDYRSWIYAIIAFGCAFTHEAFAIPVGIALLIYMLVNYRLIGVNNSTLIALFYGIGCLLLLVAPGMENKTQHIGYVSIEEYIQQLFTTLRSLRVFPLCILVAIASCCRTSWRKNLISFIKDNRYLLLITTLSLIIILALCAGARNMRVFYATEFFALLSLLRYVHLLLNHVSQASEHKLALALSILCIAWCAVIIPVCYESGKGHHNLFTQYQNDDDGVLFLPEENIPRYAERWTINLHKLYYHTPESEWRGFVIPLAHLTDSLKAPYPLLTRNENLTYALYNKYILILPHSVQAAIESSEEFFTPQHKVKGNNPFYITSDSCYIITPTDSLSTEAKWQWHYYQASLNEPSASLPGYIRRLVAPQSLPLTAPVEYPDTITLPDKRSYVIYNLTPYRTLNSIEPQCEKQ